jgi:nucleoside-diphosphate-sugar epimerase
MTSLILKVLILGGTTFLGPHLVQELQERGHEVTLFNEEIAQLILLMLKNFEGIEMEILKNSKEELGIP